MRNYTAPSLTVIVEIILVGHLPTLWYTYLHDHLENIQYATVHRDGAWVVLTLVLPKCTC